MPMALCKKDRAVRQIPYYPVAFDDKGKCFPPSHLYHEAKPKIANILKYLPLFSGILKQIATHARKTPLAVPKVDGQKPVSNMAAL